VVRGHALFGKIFLTKHNLGDKFIKGTDISWGQILINVAFSATLGAAFAGAFFGLSKAFSALKVKMFEGKPPKLSEFNGRTTEGVLRTPDGRDISFESGGGKPPSFPQYRAQSATHVEGKAAIYMRENGIMEATIYHNNTNGICGFCDRQVPALLPEGARLTVIPPSDAVANNARAVVVPTTYVGNSTIPTIKF
jgi:hypothetical protein